MHQVAADYHVTLPKHCKYALTTIAVARATLSAAQKPEGGE